MEKWLSRKRPTIAKIEKIVTHWLTECVFLEILFENWLKTRFHLWSHERTIHQPQSLKKSFLCWNEWKSASAASLIYTVFKVGVLGLIYLWDFKVLQCCIYASGKWISLGWRRKRRIYVNPFPGRIQGIYICHGPKPTQEPKTKISI